LVGINPDPALPGFKHIVIKPRPLCDLTFAEARYESVRGPIACRWQRGDGELSVTVEIPANTSATLYLPSSEVESIRESGRPLSESMGVDLQHAEADTAIIKIESGTYEFTTNLDDE